MKIYTRKHTNKTAFEKHKAGLKKRGAKIDKIVGMTITYHFNVSPSKNTSIYEN
jgi:Na+-translocating ferredoxin:NAD+ oxidoreductase RnfG subunit